MQQDEALGKSSLVFENSPERGPVRSWPQPRSEGLFDRNSYCGATAVANLLGWYDIEKSPRTAINEGCWSVVGTTPATMHDYLQREHGDLGCVLSFVPSDRDPLETLRSLLFSGRPPIILFGTGGGVLHWAVVSGVRNGDGGDPWIEFMSWGAYKRVRWSALEPRWRRPLGLHHPFLACNKTSPRGPLPTH